MISTGADQCNAELAGTGGGSAFGTFASASPRGRPDGPEFVCFQAPEPDRTARDADLEPRLPRVEVNRQGYIGQAVGGEQLQAGPVRIDDEPLLAADEWRRGRLAGDAELAPRRVEDDLDTSDLQRQDDSPGRARIPPGSRSGRRSGGSSGRRLGVIRPKDWAIARDRRRSSSATGCQASRGPSGVVCSPSTIGSDIIWLNGMPGVAVWPQPICTTRPCGSSLKVCAA